MTSKLPSLDRASVAFSCGTLAPEADERVECAFDLHLAAARTVFMFDCEAFELAPVPMPQMSSRQNTDDMKKTFQVCNIL